MDDVRMNRRGFLRRAGSAGAAAGFARLRGAAAQQARPFTQPLGVQLYTLRQILPKGPDKVMEALAGIGYREVELLDWDLKALGAAARKAGLRCPSGHFSTPLVTGDWAPWKEERAAMKVPEDYNLATAIAQAQELGVRYFGIAYLMPSERKGLDFYRRFADQMNRAGADCRKAGLRIFYHHHAFEFAPEEGKRPFDLLLERLDSQLVGLEIDTFWIAAAGENPVTLLKQLKGRVPLVHLKDMAAGTPAQFDDNKMPPTAYKEVGSGTLDFKAILKACETAGVEHYFIEQDYCPGDPVSSVRSSYEYLRRLRLT